MAKRKRKRKKKQNLKQVLLFEIGALTLLALSIITIAKLGIVGETFVYFFRFIAGEWYIVLPLALIVLSIVLIWNRTWPNFLQRQLIGVYIIFCSILLLSHVSLFQLLGENSPFQNTSVIANTWELFWMDVQGKLSTLDLGGGMVGAVLFAMFHMLFDSGGAKLIAWLFIVIGLILVTGKSFSESIHQLCKKIGGF